MVTGEQLVEAAAEFLGEPYDQSPGRTSPTSGYKDCSGLIVASCTVAGVPMPAMVSVTQFEYCRDNGGLISFLEAMTIAGALLFCPEDATEGWGNNGHVGFSAGDGTTIEATPPRVQHLRATYQPWSSSCAGLIIPGVDYGRTPPPPPPRKAKHMNYVVPVDQPDKPIFWFRDGVGSYVGEVGDEGFIIKTLQDAGEPLYTSASPVSLDFKKQFTILRDYVKPAHL